MTRDVGKVRGVIECDATTHTRRRPLLSPHARDRGLFTSSSSSSPCRIRNTPSSAPPVCRVTSPSPRPSPAALRVPPSALLPHVRPHQFSVNAVSPPSSCNRTLAKNKPPRTQRPAETDPSGHTTSPSSSTTRKREGGANENGTRKKGGSGSESKRETPTGNAHFTGPLRRRRTRTCPPPHASSSTRSASVAARLPHSSRPQCP